MADRPRSLLLAVGCLVAGALAVLLALTATSVLETLLVGGQTRHWCEGTRSYESPSGPVQRCVRERDDHNLVVDDRHRLELYRGGSPDRYDAQPWPFRGKEITVAFEPDGVRVSDAEGTTVTYPNSLYDDSR
ncbi:hypothetical protein [Janibacter corallicola]|uniref:hypothetical protein n=1 Tax=Janibacter corallicola TaxID=415212 RepID=UPI000830F69F|nr:hypothetical protein [Janibacter corallicola]